MKKVESESKGEARLRTFVKFFKDIQMTLNQQELIKIAY